ncbi:hypothetical protein L202_01373 [Cryptococcus amylolentus CBS 6039]|uniref:Uncharacterized protein n=2 Tax=Cryptococcus amylolentus TaxID=104669 RepID=A0A1E3I3F4_9TREE|nr:hypothetical protein L202_01373 [Cryptococcus amylolentus CBS 6039]ODN83183.1 hypothetical protein L202_01373 [Cryptococcus amylolentus CBS 6039]ODO10762.1 hypothetical protein I350_01359 [Cryptococcus amylolentus CBS 6273]
MSIPYDDTEGESDESSSEQSVTTRAAIDIIDIPYLSDSEPSQSEYTPLYNGWQHVDKNTTVMMVRNSPQVQDGRWIYPILRDRLGAAYIWATFVGALLIIPILIAVIAAFVVILCTCLFSALCLLLLVSICQFTGSSE